MATHKLQYLGKEVVGHDVPFRVVDDGTVVLDLEDGARIRLRTLMLDVIKTDEKGPDGERLYIVQSAQQLILDTPPEEDRQ